MVLSKKTNLKVLREKLADISNSIGLETGMGIKCDISTKCNDKSLKDTVKDIEKKVRGRKKQEKLIDGHMLLCA